MRIFEANLDRETGDSAGAGGTFQVASLEEETEAGTVDRTELIDQGKHYSSLNGLAKDIARALGIDLNEVRVEEV
jgi:type I restriction enzyme S subunit